MRWRQHVCQDSLPKSPSSLERSWGSSLDRIPQLGYPGIDHIPTTQCLGWGRRVCELLLTASPADGSEQEADGSSAAPGGGDHHCRAARVLPHPSFSRFPGSAACPSGHSCTKETIFPLEPPCLHCSPFRQTRSVKRRGSKAETDSSSRSRGWVFFPGEEDVWIQRTLIAGLGGARLCRSSALWDGARLLQDHRHPELDPGW